MALETQVAAFAKKYGPSLVLLGFVLTGLSVYFVTRSFAEETYARKEDVAEFRKELREISNNTRDTADNVLELCVLNPAAKCKR